MNYHFEPRSIMRDSHLTELWNVPWIFMPDGYRKTLRGHKYKFSNGVWIFEIPDDASDASDAAESKPAPEPPSGTFDIRELDE